MRKGGYQIIDLHDINIPLNEAVIVQGVYEKIEGSYRKPLLFSGLTIGEIEHNDMFLSPTISETDYVFSLLKYSITIKSDDTITITINN